MHLVGPPTDSLRTLLTSERQIVVGFSGFPQVCWQRFRISQGRPTQGKAYRLRLLGSRSRVQDRGGPRFSEFLVDRDCCPRVKFPKEDRRYRIRLVHGIIMHSGIGAWRCRSLYNFGYRSRTILSGHCEIPRGSRTGDLEWTFPAKTFHQPFINSRLDSPPIRPKRGHRSHKTQ